MSARFVEIRNGSSRNIDVYVTTSVVYKIGTILSGHSVRWPIPDRYWAGNFRVSADLNATRAEFLFNINNSKDRYYINSTPPGSHVNSSSYARCVRQTQKTGFNTGVTITPVSQSGAQQPTLSCQQPGGHGAKTFPADRDKIRECPNECNYLVVFGKPSKSTNIYGHPSKVRMFRKEGILSIHGRPVLDFQY